MAEDLVLDPPVDGQLQLDDAYLNRNVRNALFMILAPQTCFLQKTNTMTVLAGPTTWNPVPWNTLISDSEDPDMPIFSSGSNTRVTCRTPGWYEVTAGFAMTIDNAGNTLTVAFRVNGDANEIYAGDTISWVAGGVDRAVTFGTLIPLEANAYVECIVRMSRLVNLTSLVNWGIPRLAFRRVRGHNGPAVFALGASASVPRPTKVTSNSVTLKTISTVLGAAEIPSPDVTTD